MAKNDNGHRVDATRFVEEGAAFMELSGLPAARPATAEHFDVIVIGGGQAGLSVGYHLARRGLRFVILDRCARIGDVWRSRWSSLRLFTPSQFNGLDGMPFPGPKHRFPTKDEFADYLEAYARRFELPVRTGVEVERLWRRDGRYIVTTRGGELQADHVVIAMASYQRPKVPAFAHQLASDIVQLHSAAYRSPSQLRPGGVLIVGGGNSGAEIGIELAREQRIWISGRDNGQVPFRIDGWLGRLILVRLVLRVLFHRIMTVRTPMGRRMRSKVLSHGGPLIRVKWKDLWAAGVERVPRTVGVENGLPVLEDGRVLDVANVVWCTGFHPGFSWIDLPVFGDDGRPRHRSGVVEDQPGLYFVGLEFVHAFSSTMIHGVGRDAERIGRTIAARARLRQHVEEADHARRDVVVDVAVVEPPPGVVRDHVGDQHARG